MIIFMFQIKNEALKELNVINVKLLTEIYVRDISELSKKIDNSRIRKDMNDLKYNTGPKYIFMVEECIDKCKTTDSKGCQIQ